MAEPIKNVTLGGLTYNANEAKGRKIGQGKFEITFNSGEKLTYPDQSGRIIKTDCDYAEFYLTADGKRVDCDNVCYNGDTAYTYVNGNRVDVSPARLAKPKVSQTVTDGWIYDDTHFDISEVMGATFTSHKDTVSDVKLKDCKNTTVNLAANNSKWYGDEAKIEGGEGNEVILDDKDHAYKKGSRVEGKGTAAQKDYK